MRIGYAHPQEYLSNYYDYKRIVCFLTGNKEEYPHVRSI